MSKKGTIIEEKGTTSLLKSSSSKTTGKRCRCEGKAIIEKEAIVEEEAIIGKASSSEESKTSGTSEAGGNTANRVAIESKNSTSEEESVIVVKTIKYTNLV